MLGVLRTGHPFRVSLKRPTRHPAQGLQVKHFYYTRYRNSIDTEDVALPRSDWSCSAGNLLEPIRCIALTIVVTRCLRSFFKRHFAGESIEGVIYKDRIPEPKIQGNHLTRCVT